MQKLFDVLKTTLLCVPAIVVFEENGFGFGRVSGNSMHPSLNPDDQVDWLLLNRWSHRNYNYEHGQVVVLKSPENPKHTIIKRIVGLEGDVVWNSQTNRYVKIPKGHCWVEGDHQEISRDSRAFGPLSLGLLDSRAVFIVWPPSRIGPVSSKKI